MQTKSLGAPAKTRLTRKDFERDAILVHKEGDLWVETVVADKEMKTSGV